jgi:hypothetical protein
VPCDGGDGVAEPTAIAAGQQNFAINTAEAFGVGVIDKLSQVRHWNVRRNHWKEAVVIDWKVYCVLRVIGLYRQITSHRRSSVYRANVNWRPTGP